VEHQHRHPDETAIGDAVQRGRPGAESEQALLALREQPPVGRVGVHDPEPVEHVTALREHCGVQSLDQLLGGRPDADPAVVPDELVGQRRRIPHVSIVRVVPTSCRNALASRWGYIAIMALWIPSALYADAHFDRWAQTVLSLVSSLL